MQKKSLLWSSTVGHHSNAFFVLLGSSTVMQKIVNIAEAKMKYFLISVELHRNAKKCIAAELRRGAPQ